MPAPATTTPAARGGRGDAARRPDETAIYRAFSMTATRCRADSLCDADELGRLRHLLDQQLSHLQSVIARLANRLQRRLLAKQTRAWSSISKRASSTRPGSRAS